MKQSLSIVAEALGPAGRRGLWLLGLLTLLGGAAEFVSLAALLHLIRGWMADGGSLPGGGAFFLFAAAVLSAGAIRFVLLLATEHLAARTGHRLIIAVQRRILARDWQSHAQARGSGPLAAIGMVEQWLFGMALPLLQAGVATVLGAAIMAGLLFVDWRAAVVAAGLLGLLFVAATLVVRPFARRAGKTLGDGYEQRIAIIQEHVGAMRELILAGARGQAATRFALIDRRLANARAEALVANATPRILVESFGLVALALVVWFVAGQPGGLTAAIPTLAALALGAQRLLPLVQTISHAVTSIASARPFVDQLTPLLSRPDLDEGPRPAPLPFERELRIEGVCFRYGGRDEPALSGVDLVIPRGARVALTGPNGSGKSTLADLVMGLLPPMRGRILIDGVELTPSLIGAWQRNVAHVPQAPFVADASIAANIAFMDPEPDPARIEEAARLAGLEELTASLPGGLDTRVGERGQLLSGGQRQRLALARALYSPAPLLVLDEATSALDSESEAHVKGALDALQQRGTTILLIAHSDMMVAGSSSIVRLENGSIVAQEPSR